jgi:hypothetical protein
MEVGAMKINAEDYKTTIHQLIDKISDTKTLKRIYNLVAYLYNKPS